MSNDYSGRIPREGTVRRVLLVFGTRPEAIKMCPLVQALRQRRDRFETAVCVTGQHREMLEQVLGVFGVQPDYDLHVMRPGQSLADITREVIGGIDRLVERERPDLVLVHGDTTTSFAAALACFYRRIPVGHVEAGLRTGDLDRPWPEEFNRRTVDLVSRYRFAPTQRARQNLLDEQCAPESVFVTGNTGIDALRTTVLPDYHSDYLEWSRDSRLVLLTAHRREALGMPMHSMFRAIRQVVADRPDVKVLYPVHPNPAVQEAARAELYGCDRIKIVDPMSVLDFHNVLARCYLVLTDSGGIQEEAPSLGKPVLVMRDATERPEGVEAGTLKLIGTTGNSVARGFSRLLDDPDAYAEMSRASNPYGDGHACERIIEVLERA